MEGEQPLPNIPAKTLGGMQFWTEVRLFHEWRIQRNALTGHHRLLDGHDQRHAWGSLQACEAELQRIATQRGLPPMRGPAVVLLHGLFRTRNSMSRLAKFLEDEGEAIVLNVGYASTRGQVSDHASALASVIAHLDGIDEISFVAHSLGNLVIRCWLANISASSSQLKSEPRLRRFVMLGPPNHQPQIAEMLVPLDMSKQITGKSAQQLASDWRELESQLATPEFEFGILAGGRQDDEGYNPLVSGDDDMVVRVEEARLQGAADFRVLPVWHSTMMEQPSVHQLTLRFLQHGYFESERERAPIL